MMYATCFTCSIIVSNWRVVCSFSGFDSDITQSHIRCKFFAADIARHFSNIELQTQAMSDRLIAENET
jgi:hypothetical protein